MNTPPLPELAERDAPPHIAAIYAELRTTLGVPMVNLVFRHMATVPGCLEWAWARLAPLYRARPIHAAGMVLSGADARVPGTPASKTLAAYIRANPINLIGLELLSRDVQDAPLATGAPDETPASIEPIDAVLPMADLATLPPAAATQLTHLAHLLHGAPGPVIPSLFRHFVAVPGALARIEVILRDLLVDGDLDRAGTTMLEAGQRAAEGLRTRPHPRGAPDARISQTIAMLAQMFPPNMARMTVVARALSDAPEFR